MAKEQHKIKEDEVDYEYITYFCPKPLECATMEPCPWCIVIECEDDLDKLMVTEH